MSEQSNLEAEVFGSEGKSGGLLASTIEAAGVIGCEPTEELETLLKPFESERCPISPLQIAHALKRIGRAPTKERLTFWASKPQVCFVLASAKIDPKAEVVELLDKVADGLAKHHKYADPHMGLVTLRQSRAKFPREVLKRPAPITTHMTAHPSTIDLYAALVALLWRK